MEKYPRRCDATGRGMYEGYVFGDGELYFSEEKHLIKHLRSRDSMNELSDEFILNEAYEQDLYYYSEWSKFDIDDVYYDAEGNEYEKQ